MSQRRKRRNLATGKGKSGSLMKWLIAICVILLVAVSLAYKSAIDYLHSTRFRETIAVKISEVIGARSQLGEMQWSMLHMENEGFSARSEGALQNVQANGIELNVASDFLTSDAWTLSDVVVQTADIELDLTKKFTTIDAEIKPKSWIEKQLPEKAEVTGLKVLRADAKVGTTLGDIGVSGTSVSIEKEGYGYSAEVVGGSVDLPLFVLTHAELERMKMRMLNQRVVLDFAELSVMDSGRLELDGEVDFSADSIDYELHGNVTGLKCADIINEDWKQRLSGDVESSFSAQPSAGGDLDVRGNVLIRDGQLTALPVLDTIAAYTAVRDFKTLRFSEFRCDVFRRGSLFRLSNIYLHCDGLMRIEGYLDFKGQEIAGTFQVGLNPGTVSHIPGAEEKVFLPGKEGMSWTTVRIGGTVDDVTEDLSDRMVAAAGERLFEMIGGEMMLKFGGSAEDRAKFLKQLQEGEVNQLLKGTNGSVLEVGKDLLDSDELLTDPVKSGTDLLQNGLGGFFGGSSREKPSDEKKEDE
ncbi:hypothetical protein ACFPK9_01865 [Rubritalea spongiae]|uniref:AsmA-like C-terminal domain-containing protein n=1 Tax=Rubritalea spongiae TaxID=430797 RepID=A0ABW5E2S1_9BACT